ncbi:MAG: CBS domain-containing protein [Moritella sp.]|uniref:CBS domain-containing protein n=1 Tax=unclassified Moritella TaxID=2637987 RepID=UPI000156872E|nr:MULTISPECIES: CBS domain-containing protein [unclassified Moritella]EDM67021.1 CBS domain protein [Moritella sp. PE36]MBL1418181.1 CBS domain-containing protein [Moritella sp.]
MNSLKVSDYMQLRPIKLTADMPVATAVDRLLKSGHIGAPVVDDSDTLIGWISEQDCLASLLESSYYCEEVAIVEDLMRSDVLTVRVEDGIIELAQQMLEVKPKVYPVIDEEGLLVGIISRRDVLKAMDKQQQACYKNAANI